MEISREMLQSVLDDCGIEESQIRWDYSGRGMYGRVCFGFTGRYSHLFEFGIRLGIVQVDLESSDEGVPLDLESFSADLCIDNMGYDYIFYWPNLQVTS